MEKLINTFKNPSSFDSGQNYVGEIPDSSLFVVMSRNRDSDLMTESNWVCALEMLGGESDNVHIVRFGHWACGWIEYLCVVEGSVAEEIGQSIEDQLESYPILDEDDLNLREHELANSLWAECYSISERIDYIRSHRDDFFFYDVIEMMSCVRGKYFAGDSSALIG